MLPIIKNIIKLIVRYNIRKDKTKISLSGYHKQVRDTKVELIHILQEVFFMIMGVLSAGFGLKGFLLPNEFIDGGVMGISLIISELTLLPLSIFIVLINLPFIIMGYSTISRQFAFRSIFAIILLALCVHFIPFPTITNDKLLIAIFGGFFLGLGIGLAMRGGAVIDGTEVLAIFISKKTTATIGDVILIFNIMIFSFGAYVFSIEISLYAMLTYLAASKTVDFIVSGIEEYVGVTIISDNNEEIRQAIIKKMGRGCTLYNGKRGYGETKNDLKDIDIVYTLVTRLELSKLHTEIDKVDKNAFVVMHSIKDARGGIIKKRPLE